MARDVQTAKDEKAPADATNGGSLDGAPADASAAGASKGMLDSGLPFIMVFGGCMSSIVSMEYVLKGDPNAGNLLTLTEFAAVLLQSVPSRIEQRDGRVQLCGLFASLSSHALHAVLWVSMSILVNYVYGFNITVPIHTLFRSCNIIASVLIGFCFFQQRYSWQQLACVVVLTFGILCGSIGDAKKFASGGSSCTDCGHDATSKASAQPAEEADAAFRVWMAGIAILVFVQLLQGTLGHMQALFYRKFKDAAPRNVLADEFLFTSHAASILPMLALWQDIATAGKAALSTPPVASFLPIPSRVAWILVNNLTQLICIKGVFRLTAHYSPLTCNITMSVRKFLSVVFSIIWFGNAWTPMHSIATVLIFGGVFAYSQCPRPEDRPVKPASKTD
eukprot:TRINITY_DN36464_c0_g1_i1.p1 TRINITY_DN36464_c0_g1~~TRINITY_DN36464_c0_g1_i1.p1  ORF type:complete len:391 (-),score=59.91 TRINITY_DN36464_c0_g1_i1:287-1459(-)